MTADGLPEGWRRVPLLSAVDVASGQVDPRVEPYRSMPLIAPNHIESESGRLLRIESAADQGAISGKYFVAPGDIIYSKIRPYLRKATLVDFACLCSADMYPLKPRPGLDGRYVLAVLLGHEFSRFAEAASVRSGIPKINRTELAEFQIALPEPNEQRAIGRTLQRIDSLHRSVERLIAKTRNVKRATMQLVLTGGARLSGFTGAKEEHQLGEVAHIRKGVQRGRRELSESGPYPVWNGGISPSGFTTEYNAEANRITVSEGGNSCGYVGYVPQRFWLGGHCYELEPKDVVEDRQYLFQVLKLAEPQIMALRVGSGLPNIQKSQLASCTVTISPDPEEQRAVAGMLSSMDAEIESLETYLAKSRDVARGVTQDLLSGRRLLSLSETVEALAA